jgi:hypothetical protein
MKILQEAGMPDGVINLVTGPGPVIGPPVLNDVNLGGVHFTGSTYVFSGIWLTIGSDIRKYQSYPRIVGETGGKDFIFAHESADVEALVANIVRGAFEYQGQCSAASRAYIPDSCGRGQTAAVRRDRHHRRRRDFRLHERGDRAAFSRSRHISSRSDPHGDLCGGTYRARILHRRGRSGPAIQLTENLRPS